MNLKDYFSKGMKNSIVEMETIPNPDEANEACKSKVEEDTSIDTEKEPKKDEETPQLIDGEIDFEQVAKDAAPTADDLQGEPIEPVEPSETPSVEPTTTEEMPSEPVATEEEPLPPVEADDSGEYLEPIEDDEDKEAVPEAEEDSVEEMPDDEAEFEEMPDDENFEEMPNDEAEVEEISDDEVVEDDTSVEISDDDADVEEISDEDVEEISDEDVEEVPAEDNDEVEEISDEDAEVDGNENDDEYIQSVRAGHDSALIDHGVEVGYNLAASMLKKYYEGKINEETLMTTLKRRKSIYESITGSSTGKKTELNGQTQSVKTSEPVKTTPVKTNPVKTAEPVKTAPVKTNEPVKTEPTKISEPVKTTAVKTSEPDKKVQPVNESKGAYQKMNEEKDKLQKEKFMNELFSLPIENQSQLNESNKEIAELQQKLIESQKQLIVERAVSPLTEMQKINVRPMLDELTRSINDVDKFKTMVNNAVALVSTQKPEQKATVVESVSINNNNNADNDIVKKAMSLIDKIR